MLTVYGRKPAMEVLLDSTLECHALHLADSNRDSEIIARLREQAQRRGIPVRVHSREALARISKNGRQDQGVAVDVVCPAFTGLDAWLAGLPHRPAQRLLALDSITNPQNLGMIIRSAAAGGIDGILLSRRGNAALGPLVVKASAGTVYRAPLVSCDDLPVALRACHGAGVEICLLAADAPRSLFVHRPRGHCAYVLGNESDGVSEPVRELADTALAIPMANGVESLNVAVTASLIAYAGLLTAPHLDR